DELFGEVAGVASGDGLVQLVAELVHLAERAPDEAEQRAGAFAVGFRRKLAGGFGVRGGVLGLVVLHQAPGEPVVGLGLALGVVPGGAFQKAAVAADHVADLA